MSGAEPSRSPEERMVDAQAEQTGVTAGFQGATGPSNRYELVESITNVDLQGNLPESSYELLINLTSKALPLGNYSEKELHQLKWELEILREKYYAMHPHEDSEIRGATRAWVHDDPNASLEPLAQRHKLVVDQFFDIVWMRLTPGQDFAQQEIFATSISESRINRPGKEEKGGILGRLGR